MADTLTDFIDRACTLRDRLDPGAYAVIDLDAGEVRIIPAAVLDPLLDPAPRASACITGKPCTLGCSLFCALEPTDDDEPGWGDLVTWHCTACQRDFEADPILPGPCPHCGGNR